MRWLISGTKHKSNRHHFALSPFHPPTLVPIGHLFHFQVPPRWICPSDFVWLEVSPPASGVPMLAFIRVLGCKSVNLGLKTLLPCAHQPLSIDANSVVVFRHRQGVTLCLCLAVIRGWSCWMDSKARSAALHTHRGHSVADLVMPASMWL